VARRLTGPAVLTRLEVAQVVGVHPATVARWAGTGVLPFFRTPSGERRYRRQDVQEFLNRPGQGPRARLVTQALDAVSAENHVAANEPVDRAQSGNRVPGRSRVQSRTTRQGGGMEAGDWTVAVAQAIPAETA
jgi:excisionase family DNA binding protein